MMLPDLSNHSVSGVGRAPLGCFSSDMMPLVYDANLCFVFIFCSCVVCFVLFCFGFSVFWCVCFLFCLCCLGSSRSQRLTSLTDSTITLARGLLFSLTSNFRAPSRKAELFLPPSSCPCSTVPHHRRISKNTIIIRSIQTFLRS